MKWRWVRIKFPPDPKRSLDFEKHWSKVLKSRQRPEKDWVQVKTDAGRGSEVSNSRSRPKDSKVWVKTERCRRSTILKSRQLTRTKSKSRQILRRRSEVSESVLTPEECLKWSHGQYKKRIKSRSRKRPETSWVWRGSINVRAKTEPNAPESMTRPWKNCFGLCLQMDSTTPVDY